MRHRCLFMVLCALAFAACSALPFPLRMSQRAGHRDPGGMGAFVQAAACVVSLRFPDRPRLPSRARRRCCTRPRDQAPAGRAKRDARQHWPDTALLRTTATAGAASAGLVRRAGCSVVGSPGGGIEERSDPPVPCLARRCLGVLGPGARCLRVVGWMSSQAPGTGWTNSTGHPSSGQARPRLRLRLIAQPDVRVGARLCASARVAVAPVVASGL